ncbi:MAG: hypothetical protein NZM25_11645 [Leptospiraceae bacterium]|nr:hypothetical protein [Leptospiraceae bacterium]MDW8307409.1 hypothetical protein [Leptospiraceae bacterium]
MSPKQISRFLPMKEVLHFRISAAVLFSVLTGLLLYLVYVDEGTPEKQRQIAQVLGTRGTSTGTSFFQVPRDWLYQDAPNPDTTLESFLKSRELWPDIANKPYDEAHKEKVRREWLEFAARYPDNIFIPNEYKNLTPQQKEAIRRDNERAIDYATRRAALEAREKYREAGQSPPDNLIVEPNPAEHRAWLNYKIRETKSVIEIIEYFLEKGNPTSEQIELGKQDLERLRKELKEYEELLAKTPKD